MNVDLRISSTGYAFLGPDGTPVSTGRFPPDANPMLALWLCHEVAESMGYRIQSEHHPLTWTESAA